VLGLWASQNLLKGLWGRETKVFCVFSARVFKVHSYAWS
jgi:hypothetical protein